MIPTKHYRSSSYTGKQESSFDSESITYQRLLNESKNTKLSKFEKFIKEKIEYGHTRTSSLVTHNQESSKRSYGFRIPILAKDLHLTSKLNDTNADIESEGSNEEELPTKGSQVKLGHFMSSAFLKKDHSSHRISNNNKNILSRRTSVGGNQYDSLSELDPKCRERGDENSMSMCKMKHDVSRTTYFTGNGLNDSCKTSKILTKLNSHNISYIQSANDLFNSKMGGAEDQTLLGPEQQDAVEPSIIMPENMNHLHVAKIVEESTSNRDLRSVSEVELQQKLESILTKQVTSRPSSCYRGPRDVVPGTSIQIAKQIQKEIELQNIHKDLIQRLQKHCSFRNTEKPSVRKVRVKLAPQDASCSPSKTVLKASYNQSIDEGKSGKSFSVMSTKRNSIDVKMETSLIKPKAPKVGYIPEWLKKRDDFKEAYGNKAEIAKRTLVNICEKQYKGRSLRLSELFRSISRTEEEIKAVSEWLQKVKVFKYLPEFVVHNVASRIRSAFYQKGEFLCKQGELEDCLFVIFDGSVRSIKNFLHVGVYYTYDSIGHSPLEEEVYRTCTLVAETPVIALKLARQDYRAALEQHVNIQKTAYFFLLNEIHSLKDIEEDKKKTLCSKLKLRHYVKGETIYNEGDEAECFYILKSGKVQLESEITVHKENILPLQKKKWEKVKCSRKMNFKHDISPKHHFGEIELLENSKRLNKVVCAEDAEVLILKKHYFFDIFNIDDIRKIRWSLQSRILEDITSLEQRVLKEEALKRQIKKNTLDALLDYRTKIDRNTLFRSKAHSLQPIEKKVKEDFSLYLRKNITKVEKTSEEINYNPYIS